jgi:holo-[acyl-carrier protein] synthase
VIYGIGIDIVKVERMRKAVERWGERFLRRVFTDAEVAYAYKKAEPWLSLSVRFAAKEAFIKAAGSGVPLLLTDVEVLNAGDGRPFLKVKGGAGALFESESIRSAHLSLSHERDYGVACVVLEK